MCNHIFQSTITPRNREFHELSLWQSLLLLERVPSMEFNDEQSKPSYQVPATTVQVVSNISTSTTTQLPQPLNAPTSNVISSSSPVVIDLDTDGKEDNCGISLKNQDPPPGFCPSDLELLTLYLKRRVLDQQLPSNKIVEVKLYDHSPEWLTGFGFSWKIIYPNGFFLLFFNCFELDDGRNLFLSNAESLFC